VNRVPQVSRAQLVFKVRLVPMGLVEIQVLKVNKEQLVNRELMVPLVRKVNRALMEQLVNKVNKV
jgi:hypothetical protein